MKTVSRTLTVAFCLATAGGAASLAQGSDSYGRDDYPSPPYADQGKATSGSDYYGLPGSANGGANREYKPPQNTEWRLNQNGAETGNQRAGNGQNGYNRNLEPADSQNRRTAETPPPYAPPSSYGRGEYGRKDVPQTYGEPLEQRPSAGGWKNPDQRPPYRESPRANGRYESGYGREPRYGERRLPPPGRLEERTYSPDEILNAGHKFFGKVNAGLAKIVQNVFAREGRPVGYILGEEGSGAVFAGLNYGEGQLYTKYWGSRRVYWQGPSIGYDFGANGARTLTLVYNLDAIENLYGRYGGVSGSAYVVGGVGITFQKKDNILLAPIRSGVGLRLGANMGYLKYTRRPTWNPF